MLSVSCGAKVGGRPGKRKRREEERWKEYGEDKGYKDETKEKGKNKTGKGKKKQKT